MRVYEEGNVYISKNCYFNWDGDEKTDFSIDYYHWKFLMKVFSWEK